MSVITKRSSVSDLSQQILEMGRTGVYRESVFEALHPIATKKQIRLAIAHAKQFGLHSVASLRDAELGTYYEVDVEKYQSLHHKLQQSLHSDLQLERQAIATSDTQDLVTKVVNVTVVVQLMLATVRGLAIASLMIGLACLLSGQQPIGFGLLISAAITTTIWMIQKAIAQKMI
jgi:hypothetical protein